METNPENYNVIIEDNPPKKIKKVKKKPKEILDFIIQDKDEIIVKEEEEPENITINKVINKGTGAGGANTNLNGLSYEEKTNLEPHFIILNLEKKNGLKTIKFTDYEHEFINANKNNLYTYLENIGEKNVELQQAAGCKQPDEAYIDLNRKIIFIIEKKFQQTPGSVDEKIQTGAFKKLHYSQQFPNFKIKYIYCLSDWFKRNEYKSVLDYLKQNDIPIFWGNDENYKNDIIKFLCI